MRQNRVYRVFIVPGVAVVVAGFVEQALVPESDGQLIMKARIRAGLSCAASICRAAQAGPVDLADRSLWVAIEAREEAGRFRRWRAGWSRGVLTRSVREDEVAHFKDGAAWRH